MQERGNPLATADADRLTVETRDSEEATDPVEEPRDAPKQMPKELPKEPPKELEER